MILYKHKIIVFGGFYDTLREVRYYSDLHVFDLDQYKWQEIKPTPGCMWPNARSGFQFFVYQDEVNDQLEYIYMVVIPKKFHLIKALQRREWSLDPKTWEWNKVKKSGMPPRPRAGFSMCIHRKWAILFGGVVDIEMEGDVMMSLFLNELYGFQLDTHRWYPLELRKEKSTKNKQKQILDEQADIMDIDNKTSAMKVDANNEDEDLDYEEDASTKGNINKMSLNMKRNVTIDDGNVASRSEEKPVVSSSKSSAVQHSASADVVKPSRRINSCMAVAKDTLYIYGGMMEIRDQEITLDDLYILNLSKLDEWKCIIPASESEWVEASDNEDEDDSENEECESGDDSDEDTDEEDDVEARNGASTSLEAGDAVTIIRGEGKTLRRKEKQARIEQIRASLGLSDAQRTPVVLYSSKSDSAGGDTEEILQKEQTCTGKWQHMNTQHTRKELCKDGFDLAECRFKELKPILDELAILEAKQKAEEAEGPEKSSAKKRRNKKNKNVPSK
ncbi:hypothetical protein K7X08_024661 [Anisodus acutangulus]|uniref:DUF4110 domain-containing protein n=1 Tax=Anisodus acutangulus TaxID=402998 RepID=A0A9Q1M996_9SOLA|nr:hypothetical protein K7X08_024661 [Anisodus acutangulus]